MLDRNAGLIDSLAVELAVEPRALRALLRVESPGEGLVDGHPLVRLELHHLWWLVAEDRRSAVDARFHVAGPRSWEGHEWRPVAGEDHWTPLHLPGAAGQRQEWLALTLARSIDERAAIEATSWGAGQVLGAYWAQLGYPNQTAFAAAMAEEPAQLKAVARVLKILGVDLALRIRSWSVVAAKYNGPGQVEWYADRLVQAYNKS